MDSKSNTAFQYAHPLIRPTLNPKVHYKVNTDPEHLQKYSLLSVQALENPTTGFYSRYCVWPTYFQSPTIAGLVTNDFSMTKSSEQDGGPDRHWPIHLA